jgi:hypothetical protein
LDRRPARSRSRPVLERVLEHPNRAKLELDGSLDGDPRFEAFAGGGEADLGRRDVGSVRLRGLEKAADERQEDRPDLGLEADAAGLDGQDRATLVAVVARRGRVQLVHGSVERIEEFPEKVLVQIPGAALELILEPIN